MSAFLRPHTIIYIALLASVAQADVLHLNNGRQLEGEVIGEGKRAIHLRVRGGVIHVPKPNVRSIEKKLTASQEYSARVRKTDMGNRRAVEELAHWASRRGLGEAAKSLRKLALDHHLEEKVKAARKARSGRAFLETYRWAKNRPFSDEVLRYLLEEARSLAPELKLPAAPSAPPSLPAPSNVRPSATSPHHRKLAPITSGELPSAREAELAKRLAEQKRQSAELEKRLRTLEDARRREQADKEEELRAARLRRRRVRRRGPVGLYIGPYRVVRKPCPNPAEQVAPAPCKPRRR